MDATAPVMSGTVMSPRRKKRFLKKTADFFYAGEELILAVAYRNVPGAVTAMMRSKPPISKLHAGSR